MGNYIREFVVYLKNKEEVESFIKMTNVGKSNFDELLQDMDELQGNIDTVAFRMEEYTDGSMIRDVYLSTISGDDKYYL